jgi:hypothetical protein
MTEVTLQAQLYNSVLNQHIALNLLHWTRVISLETTQTPTPATISEGVLSTYSELITEGFSNDALTLLGRVYTNDDRLALEVAVRSWYFYSTPSTGTNLPQVIDDVGNVYEGLFGNLVWNKQSGVAEQFDYSLTFYVMVYTPAWTLSQAVTSNLNFNDFQIILRLWVGL